MTEKVETRGRKPLGEKALTSKETSKKHREGVLEAGGMVGSFTIYDPEVAKAFNEVMEKRQLTKKKAAEYLIARGLKQ